MRSVIGSFAGVLLMLPVVAMLPVTAKAQQATELYRMEIKGDRLVHRETLLSGLGRIRDIEVGADGNVYLLLEHESGSRIVRLVLSK